MPPGSSSSTEGPSREARSGGDAGASIARLGRPNGLKGFIGVYVADEDLGHLQPGATVQIDERDFEVRAVRRGNKGHEVAFEGVPDRSAAELLRGKEVFVSARRPLGADEYWPSDLIGLSVVPGGGVVVDVIHGPAQDRLVVERGELRFEVPFVRDLVPSVDVESGSVQIAEIEGLSLS